MDNRKYRTELNLRSEPSRFTLLSGAKRCQKASTKETLIVLGQDMKFWVVLPVDAHKLIKLGYEVL